MPVHWISLIPPLIVVIATLIFHQLNYALIAGIISAALITTHYDISQSFFLIVFRAWSQITNSDTIYLYLFLIFVPSLVMIFIQTKSAEAFALAITRRFKTKKQIEMATCFSSIALSIDDYLSILTVGNVMRPITDKIGIARTKLAYFIHSLSGPAVIMCPISSWVATITTYLHQSGVSSFESNSLIKIEPFYLYLQTFPFLFYSLLTFFAVGLIINRNISFGPMHTHEKNALPTTVFDQPNAEVSTQRAYELILPLGLLIGITILGILYKGNYYLFGGTNSLFEAFKNNTDIFFVLCLSSSVTLATTLIFNIIKQRISFRDIPPIIISGFALMRTVLCMIFLTSLLSSFLKNDLKTGLYLAELIKTNTSIILIPVSFFIVALIISVITGSSWGTFGLLLPIAIPMLSSLFITIPDTGFWLLHPTLGALFSGALCGDHISPFSETTIMSAAAAQTTSSEHAKTQFSYTIPVICACLVGFTLFGILHYMHMLIQYTIALGCSIGVCSILFAFFNQNKK